MIRASLFSVFFLLLAAHPASAQGPQTPSEDSTPARPVTDHAHLGVQTLPARPGQTPEGVRINYVYPESAAQTIGFRVGDEVVEINGLEVPDLKVFTRELRRENIGAKVRFKVRRGQEVLELRGPLGSYLKTRKAFMDYCQKELVGKPFAPGGEIVWPDGVNGLEALRGKVGILVFFCDSQACVELKWRKIRDMDEALERARTPRGWLGFAGIYCMNGEKHEKNLEDRKKILARYPAKFPLGVARYPGDLVPLNAAGRDPLLQDHGVAILDPKGNLIYIDFEAPGAEFLHAFQRAQKEFAPPARPDAGAEKPAGK